MKHSNLAFVFVGHGSSDIGTQRDFLRLINNFKSDTNCLGDIYYAYLESQIQQPSLKEVLMNLCSMNTKIVRYTKLFVIPLLLFSGKHSLEDIPTIISFVKKKYSSIKFFVLPPLGEEIKVVKLLQERVREVILDSDLLDNTSKTTEYVVIGRGMNKQEGLEAFNRQVCVLSELLKVEQIRYCFCAISSPKLEQSLKLITKEPSVEMKNWVFIPYLLFDGILYKKISDLIEKSLKNKASYCITKPLGVHSLILSVLEQNIFNALERSNTF